MSLGDTKQKEEKKKRTGRFFLLESKWENRRVVRKRSHESPKRALKQWNKTKRRSRRKESVLDEREKERMRNQKWLHQDKRNLNKPETRSIMFLLLFSESLLQNILTFSLSSRFSTYFPTPTIFSYILLSLNSFLFFLLLLFCSFWTHSKRFSLFRHPH